ncbi:MAG: hypothetical protein KKH61_20445 [Gammaproteobacteria bacterium]|nr:hypothetical protein [Gammaproteobacteria bacterium]
MPFEFWSAINKPEAIAGTLTIIGGAAILFNKIGLVTFGKKKCAELKKCPDPMCHDCVVKTSQKVEDLETNQKHIKTQIETVNSNVLVLTGMVSKADQNITSRLEDIITKAVEKGLRR